MDPDHAADQPADGPWPFTCNLLMDPEQLTNLLMDPDQLTILLMDPDQLDNLLMDPGQLTNLLMDTKIKNKYKEY